MRTPVVAAGRFYVDAIQRATTQTGLISDELSAFVEDDDGNLWIEGRVVHLVHAVGGAITPVPVEVAVETVPGVRRAAVVGVGPWIPCRLGRSARLRFTRNRVMASRITPDTNITPGAFSVLPNQRVMLNGV